MKGGNTANCWLALAHPDVIEIQAHRVAGLFGEPLWPNMHVSRFGVVSKKNKPDSWRLILDLSPPLNHRVNDSISKSDFPVSYSTVQDVIRLIVKTGRGALMAKVDIQKAYRIVPMHPADGRFLGMRWRDKYFVDLASPFGLRSASGIFNTVAGLCEWILPLWCEKFSSLS